MVEKSAALEGLPTKFISSIKTLFELLDDKHVGSVAFEGNVHLLGYLSLIKMLISG